MGSGPGRGSGERGKAWRGLRRRLATYPLIYLGICGFLFIFQRTFQYPGDGTPVPLPASAARTGLRDIELRTEDGLSIRGWYIPGRRAGTILFFHGNGGHRGMRLDWLEDLAALGPGAFLLDYRGYGGSEGSPTEEGLYRDAEAAIAWVRANAPGPLIFLGESLGTGVAVEMAARHDPAGLVLHAGFTSTVDVAQGHFFFVPVRWILLDRYESAAKIGAVRAPKLFFHGREDVVVPYRHGEALFAAASEPKRWVEIPGAGHEDLHLVDPQLYYGALREFIDDALRSE